MSDIKKTVKQSSQYFIGNLSVLLIGFVSFPIITRVFSEADFGLLSFINCFVFLPYALARCGIGKSAVRFYEEFNVNPDKQALSRYYSTLFWGTIGSTTIVVIFSLFGIKKFLNGFFNRDITGVSYLIVLLIFLHPIYSLFMEFFRAQQRTKLYNILTVIHRYSLVFFSLTFCVFIIKNIFGFYLGYIIPFALIVIYLLFRYYRYYPIKIKNFSYSLLFDFIKYGFPLIIYEIAHIFLTFGDRLVIQYYLQSKQLGIYAVGYDLSKHLETLFKLPFRMALAPIYMSIWVNKGKEATQIYLSKTLRYYLILMIPLILGTTAIRKELIVFVASQKYIEAHSIIFWVVSGTLIFGLASILCSGIHIYKKTNILASSTIAAGIINILLNIILVPKYKLIGAAFATFITFILLLYYIAKYSFRFLEIKIDIRLIAIAIFSSLLMYLAIINIHFANILISLFVKIVLGAFIYTTLMLIFDMQIRHTTFYCFNKYVVARLKTLKL